MNRKLFYILNLTWGLPMTIIGGLACLALIGCNKRPAIHGGCLCFTVGKNWGGISLGLVMIVSEQATGATKNHELGHVIQNAILGPLFIPIVAIPSFVRCCYYRWSPNRETLPPYDSIWFEGQATELGNRYIHKWK